MKKSRIGFTGALLFSIVFVGPQHVSACGGPSHGICSWFFQEVQEFHQAATDYIKVNGETVFAGFVDFVRNSLTLLQGNNTDLCMQFIDLCVNNVENQFTESMLAQLKTLHLVDTDATVNDTVRAIVKAIVIINPDRTITFKKLDQIIKEGIATVISAQLAAQFAEQKIKRLRAKK